MASPSDVLKSLDKTAKMQFVPLIGSIKGKIIAGITKRSKPKNILEVETLYGYSAILMTQILAGDEKVVTIEVDRLIAATARKNIANAGLSDKVEIVTGNTIELLPKLDLKFGLLFLDAAKNEYLTYLKLAEEKILKKRAIIVADNVEVSKNEMLDYLKYVRLSGLYKSETIGNKLEFTPNIRDAIEVNIKIA